MYLINTNFGLWLLLEGENFILEQNNALCHTLKIKKSGSITTVSHYLIGHIGRTIRTLNKIDGVHFLCKWKTIFMQYRYSGSLLQSLGNDTHIIIIKIVPSKSN